MDENCGKASMVDFVPETCGLLMDFVRKNPISYEALKTLVQKERWASRWSGAGKNMGLLGSFDPCRFNDTFVGNYRRAGIYKTIPTRTAAQYEYWLDEQSRLLAALMYNKEDAWKDCLETYSYETFRAYEDDSLVIFVCYETKMNGEKSMAYVYGYRYTGNELAERVEMECIGGKVMAMNSMLFFYGADQTLLSAEEYRMISPDFYTHPLVRAIQGNRGPHLSTLTYREVDYRVIHRVFP